MGGLVVAIDADVLRAAVRSRRGAGNRLLRAVAGRAVRPVVTTPLFHHYEAALSGEKRGPAFLPGLARVCVPVAVHFRTPPQFGRMEDELLFEAAVNGGAKAIVTYWAAGFRRPASRHGMKVLTPQECLKELVR